MMMTDNDTVRGGNYRLARTVGLGRPKGQYTPEEKVLEVLIAKETIRTLYAKLPTSRMKAVVAMHFELGYPQELVADVFGVTQENIKFEIDYIRKILLGGKHKTRRKKQDITQEDIVRLAKILLMD